MLTYDIREYVKTYKDFIPSDTINSILTNLKNVIWTSHTYYNCITDKKVSFDNEPLISYDVIPETETLKKCFADAVSKYLLEDIKFSWFGAWTGLTPLRFNKYNVGTEMRKHCDHINISNNNGIPILSLILSLNDDYKGGTFMLWDTQIIKMPAGSITIFPSNFLYPHRVLKVLEGVRYSVVSWVH